MTGDDTGSVDAAVATARAALGLDAREPARTWSVARMHPGARDFVLVVFGAPEGATAVAAVETASGEVLEAARLPGREPHTPMSADEAIRRAGFAPNAARRLVWDLSPASRSRFYPLWELESPDGKVWVDSVRGAVSHTLEATRGGGSDQV